MKSLPLSLLILSFCAADLRAADGSLDSSFATNGVLQTGTEWLNLQGWVLPDGKILLYQIPYPTYNFPIFRLVRFLANGQPDPDWTVYTNGPDQFHPYRIQPHADGSVYITQIPPSQSAAGPSEERRILFNGTLDPAFSRQLGILGYEDHFIDSDRRWGLTGSPLVAGSFTLTHYAPDGSPDPAWDTPAELFWSGFQAPDSKLLLLSVSSSQWQRRNADGSIDPTWSSPDDTISEGSIQLPVRRNGGAYELRIPISNDYDPRLKRLRNNGLTDASFRPAIFISRDDEGDYPYDYPCFFEQPDGKLVCGGVLWRPADTATGSPLYREPVRLNADGSLDPTFKLDSAAVLPDLGYSDGEYPNGEGAPQIVGPGTDGKMVMIFDSRIIRIQAFTPATLQRNIATSFVLEPEKNRLTLLFSGTDLSQPWNLETSANLRTWQYLETLQPDGTGLRSIELPLTQPRAFFRLKALPQP
ncbi:MAG: delta-60 repeat domain-containing protein [Verrucomicrobiales bacterium]